MTQLSAMVNLLMPRSTNAASEPTSEMPDDISFPFDALDEVEYLEDLLKVPANATKRKHMVFIMHIVHVSLHLLLLLTSPPLSFLSVFFAFIFLLQILAFISPGSSVGLY